MSIPVHYTDLTTMTYRSLTIDESYRWHCWTPSDIAELLPVLRKYGEQCEHITEFGVRGGCSTSAWLAARPKKLVCYDIGRYPEVDEIARLAKEGGIEFEFRQENTAEATIEKTDLLFIDTVHNAYQLEHELLFNYKGVKKFIIIHDTHTYGVIGEGGAAGLWLTILRFLIDNPSWKLLEHRPESNGLTVLQRIA